jgi:3-hydroxyacyl-[acyl-carrier-protein] dehydratase
LRFPKQSATDEVIFLRIEEISAHRKPWILIDKIHEIVPYQHIKTSKYISYSDVYLQGHFPMYSIYPGILLLEGIKQSLEMLIRTSGEKAVSLDNTCEWIVRFIKLVVPGDEVVYRITLANSRITGIGCVGESVVVRAKGYYRKKDDIHE